MTEQDPRALHQAQKRFFATGATKPYAFRRDALKRLTRAIQDREPALLTALAQDLGKPADEAWITEVAMGLAEADHTLSNLRQWLRPRRAPIPLLYQPAQGFVRHEPFGSCLIISPWNYPLGLALAPLISALAAGNCAVLKPSSKAPNASREIARLVAQTFPPEHVACMEGGSDMAQTLLGLGFDFVFYTGSARVGRQVMASAAGALTPVVLELGGKCPCMVDKDLSREHLAATARRIVWGKYLNAGQTCLAPDHVLAHADIKPELEQALARTIKDFYGSDPRRSPHYGRIVNQAHLHRLQELLTATRGRLILGGEAQAEERYLAPALITDVDLDDPLMAEEIFGPILPVLAVDSLDQALEIVNARPRPLALYLFSDSDEAVTRVLRDSASGGVCVNDTVVHAGPHSLPFGGVGESGLGRCHGWSGFEAFSYRRSVLRRSFRLDWRLRYPPRPSLTGWRKALLRWMS